MKRSLLLLLLISSLLAPSTISASQGQTQPRATAPQTPAATATARIPDAKIQSRVLANGLEILVLEDHSVPLVSVELAVKNGSYTEPPELNGLSHLYEHMFFKANRAIKDREDYLQSIDQLGIVYNGQTHEELVNYYFTTTTPNFGVAMRFMRDAVRYPLFDERQFEQ
ncbi:MAG: M16 family metallopeptidase [Pyrinomonadaceae bacterium]